VKADPIELEPSEEELFEVKAQSFCYKEEPLTLINKLLLLWSFFEGQSEDGSCLSVQSSYSF